MTDTSWADAVNRRRVRAGSLRLVDDEEAEREITARDRLMKEAVRLATTVQRRITDGDRVVPISACLPLLEAATKYAEVVGQDRPNRGLIDS